MRLIKKNMETSTNAAVVMQYIAFLERSKEDKGWRCKKKSYFPPGTAKGI